VTVDVGCGQEEANVTKNKQAKKDARALSQATGINYTAARRVTQNSQTVDDWDWEPKSLEELLSGSPQGACDHLLGEEIGAVGSQSTVEMDLPDNMTEPTIAEFEVPDSTMSVQVDDEFEGGTQAVTGTAVGSMSVRVTMTPDDAAQAIASGQVTYEEEWSETEISVSFKVEVEVRFNAIVNPDYEGVEDVTLDAIEVGSRI
jgi:hypothetical protein